MDHTCVTLEGSLRIANHSLWISKSFSFCKSRNHPRLVKCGDVLFVVKALNIYWIDLMILSDGTVLSPAEANVDLLLNENTQA